MWAAFAYATTHSALVCHRFIETNCVLTDSGLNEACIAINFEEITFLHITPYRMHDFAILLRSFILAHSKLPFGNGVIVHLLPYRFIRFMYRLSHPFEGWLCPRM